MTRARSNVVEPEPAEPRAHPLGDGELWHGDCARVLPRLEPGYDVVYVDPPFNAGGQRGARAGRGQRASGETAYSDAWGGLDAFLSMLEPRLEAMARVLSERGSLWLHLDYRAVHDAKVLADRLLGRGAFQGEIVWVPGNGARGKRAPSVTHQTILVYAPSGHMIWNVNDPALREPYAEISQAMHFQNTDPDGRRYRDRVIVGKRYRYYADEGRQLGSVWTDCPAMRANTPLNPEATGYPTQKPLKLLERIVLGATHPDSRVLDPMCGSGTTLAAARKQGRRFTGIDQSDVAVTVALERLGREP
ncbi:MAG: site-specific DNA-methyltransferase [Polyangiaceae bacterium]|nr:site-specific DNA-methyltransferase [Polyangiaceae bacterium]